MYKYSDNNENNDISLHDCRATEFGLDGKTLTAVFKDGLTVLESNKNNHFGKQAYTGRAEVVFELAYSDIESNVTVSVFTRTDDENKDIRENVAPADFFEMINGGMELEFLYTYKGCNAYFFECWLHFKEDPYHKECQLTIAAENVTYYWDELYPEE